MEIKRNPQWLPGYVVGVEPTKSPREKYRVRPLANARAHAASLGWPPPLAKCLDCEATGYCWHRFDAGTYLEPCITCSGYGWTPARGGRFAFLGSGMRYAPGLADALEAATK